MNKWLVIGIVVFIAVLLFMVGPSLGWIFQAGPGPDNETDGSDPIDTNNDGIVDDYECEAFCSDNGWDAGSRPLNDTCLETETKVESCCCWDWEEEPENDSGDPWDGDGMPVDECTVVCVDQAGWEFGEESPDGTCDDPLHEESIVITPEITCCCGERTCPYACQYLGYIDGYYSGGISCGDFEHYIVDEQCCCQNNYECQEDCNFNSWPFKAVVPYDGVDRYACQDYADGFCDYYDIGSAGSSYGLGDGCCCWHCV